MCSSRAEEERRPLRRRPAGSALVRESRVASEALGHRRCSIAQTSRSTNRRQRRTTPHLEIGRNQETSDPHCDSSDWLGRIRLLGVSVTAVPHKCWQPQPIRRLCALAPRFADTQGLRICPVVPSGALSPRKQEASPVLGPTEDSNEWLGTPVGLPNPFDRGPHRRNLRTTPRSRSLEHDGSGLPALGFRTQQNDSKSGRAKRAAPRQLSTPPPVQQHIEGRSPTTALSPSRHLDPPRGMRFWASGTT